MFPILLSALALLLTSGFVRAERNPCVGHVQHGKASYYYQPQRLASGGRFNPEAMTAAHRTLPFGTMVRVTNLRTNRSTVVRINDRGPFLRGRIIDLSRAAARQIAMIQSGVVPVKVEVVALN